MVSPRSYSRLPISYTPYEERHQSCEVILQCSWTPRLASAIAPPPPSSQRCPGLPLIAAGPPCVEQGQGTPPHLIPGQRQSSLHSPTSSGAAQGRADPTTCAHSRTQPHAATHTVSNGNTSTCGSLPQRDVRECVSSLQVMQHGRDGALRITPHQQRDGAWHARGVGVGWAPPGQREGADSCVTAGQLGLRLRSSRPGHTHSHTHARTHTHTHTHNTRHHERVETAA